MVEVKIAQTGADLRDGLALGLHQIAHGAADQGVALAEASNAKIEIVMGGDNGFNHLFVQPEITSIADLRGRTVIVDDPDTAYTLQMVRALKEAGLDKNGYSMRKAGGTFRRVEVMLNDKTAAATTLNPPFSIRAQMAGLKDMGEMVKLWDRYQAQTGFVMKDWANANSGTLIRYIQAYIEGLRWAVDGRNKDEAVKLLADGLHVSSAIAAQTYEIAADAEGGLAKDAELDLGGFRNVLALRAELQGQWGGTPPPTDKYVNLHYYDRARAGL